MGKGSKPTIGFWYRVAYHHGLTIGPLDAFLAFRGGDKTAWSGELTESGTIHVNAENLWGGEKDQGGIVGDLDVMFGEPTQVPNPYLVNVFGDQTAAWRGFATVAFKGGRYGAMNPYPQKPSYKFRQITSHWDDPGCWYPEKAEISMPVDFTPPAPSEGYWRVEAGAQYTLRDQTEVFGTVAEAYIATADQIGQNAIEARNAATGSAYVFSGSQYTTELDGDPGITAWDEAHGSDVGIAAVKATPICPTGFDWSVAEGTDTTPELDAPVVMCTLRGPTLLAINPAHVLYYSRTNSEMGRESRASINDASLRAAADKLYAEGFGICPDWDPATESVDEFEKRICKLIGGSFTRSLEDGQWYLDLARGDYVLADLPILTDDDILDFKEQPAVLDNAVNSVSVSFFDPQKKETVVTPPVRAMALVASFGTIHQTTDYRPIPTPGLATRVAQRDMLASATPARAFDLVTTRATWNWRPNQYFRLQAPKRGIADMVCIVGDHQAGTLKSGAIKMKVAQDNYGLPSTSFVQVEPGVDTRPPQTPTAITAQLAIEAPYVEIAAMLSRADLAALPADAGYAMAVAAGVDLDYTMMVQASGGDYVDAGRSEWCATALLNEAADYTTRDFTLGASRGLANVVPGMGVLWDDEIARVDAIDVDAGTITLGRGCADTVPAKEHAAGSRVWFYPTSFAYDATEYSDGETVNVKLLSNTGSQQYPLDSATALPLTFDQRQIRPYPPAGLHINGSVYPATVFGPDLEISFVPRDRLMQADQLIDTTAAGVGPEAGTTYTLRGYLGGTLVHTESGAAGSPLTWTPGAGGAARIEIDAVRDGMTSWQPLAADFTFVVDGELQLSGAFAGGTVGEPYSSSVPITGGSEPYTLTGGTGLVSGSLDAGFSLSITGTSGARFLTLECDDPEAADAMTFRASVDSADGQTATSDQSVSIAEAVLDPYWSNVIALVHFDDAVGSMNFADVVQPDAAGEAQWSSSTTGTSAIKTAEDEDAFGGLAAAFPGTGSTLVYASRPQPWFDFQDGDWTLEGFANLASSGDMALVGKWPNAVGAAGESFIIYVTGGKLQLSWGIGSLNTGSPGSQTIPVATRFYWCVQRRGSVIEYRTGLPGGTAALDPTQPDIGTGALNYHDGVVTLGGIGSGDLLLHGSQDEFRATQGVARYSGDIPVPADPFPDG